MPSNLPPEDQAKIKPFDRLVLDRAVIAVPLLKEMQEDLDLIAKVEKTHQLGDRVQQKLSGRREGHTKGSPQDG
jgi:hypothetical protein